MNCIPEGDIFICAGDFTHKEDWRCYLDPRSGVPNTLKAFNEWLGKLTHKHKIVISGNHEIGFNHYTADEIQKNFITHATYLQDESLTVEGIHIYGTPWTTSCGMAFSCKSSLISEKFSKIPKNTDIVLTHLPPHNILDGADGGTRHWGSQALKRLILEEIRPKVHLFGHIHEDYGYYEERGCLDISIFIWI